MAISTEPSGEPVADRRPWRAPDVVQPPEDLDERIGRIVAAALARAPPAPVNTQGRASPAVVSSAHTQSRPDNCAVQTTHTDTAQHSIETAGVPSGLTAAVGRPRVPLPVHSLLSGPARGSQIGGWSRRTAPSLCRDIRRCCLRTGMRQQQNTHPNGLLPLRAADPTCTYHHHQPGLRHPRLMMRSRDS